MIAGDNDWGSEPMPANVSGVPADDTDSRDPALSRTGEGNDWKGPNLGCGQPIAGLTNNRADLERIIAALTQSHRAAPPATSASRPAG